MPQAISTKSATRKGEVHWFAVAFAIVLLTVTTILLPFLIWFIAPLVVIGIYMSVRKAQKIKASFMMNAEDSRGHV